MEYQLLFELFFLFQFILNRMHFCDHSILSFLHLLYLHSLISLLFEQFLYHLQLILLLMKSARMIFELITLLLKLQFSLLIGFLKFGLKILQTLSSRILNYCRKWFEFIESFLELTNLLTLRCQNSALISDEFNQLFLNHTQMIGSNLLYFFIHINGRIIIDYRTINNTLKNYFW